MRHTGAVLAVVMMLAIAGCSLPASTSTSSSSTAEDPAVPKEEGRVVADAIAAGLVGNDLEVVYEHLTDAFRETTSLDDWSVDYLYQVSGRPLEFEYKMDDAGSTSTPWGTVPMRKYWYALRTSEYEMGTYFLFVEVVREGDDLACLQFSLLNFTDGIPTQLQ